MSIACFESDTISTLDRLRASRAAAAMQSQAASDPASPLHFDVRCSMLDVRCSPSSPPQDSALSTQDSRSFGNGQSSPPEPRTPNPEPSRCSPRRIAANRRNARKSTGPRTPAGKRRVSQNALKHGLAATYSHLPSECPATFNTFLHELREELHPVTVMQQYLFDQIANLIWRLRRLPEAQPNLFT